jgi:hypothetical protein
MINKVVDNIYGHNMFISHNSHPLPGTNLWLRGRIVTLNGTKMGFEDDTYELLINIRFSQADVSIAQDDLIKNPTFWINGKIARIVDDSDRSRRLALKSNLSSLYFRDQWEFPWHQIGEEPGDFPDGDFNQGGGKKPGGTTPEPEGGFWQTNFGGGEGPKINMWDPDEADTVMPGGLEPGLMKIRFDQGFYERLRDTTIAMPDWMFLDYVKQKKDGVWLVGGHVTDDDRFVFEVDDGTEIEFQLTAKAFVPKFFTSDRDVWRTTLLENLKVGDFVTSVWYQNFHTYRVLGKMIDHDEEKWLGYTTNDGEDHWTSDHNFLTRLRMSTQEEIDKWWIAYQTVQHEKDKAIKKEEDDALLAKWQAEYDAKKIKTDPVVPKKPPSVLPVAGKNDTERLRLALTELSDLRRRLVNAAAMSEIEGTGAKEPPRKKARVDIWADWKAGEDAFFRSQEKKTSLAPLLLVGGLAVLIVYAT